jgi:hypothetical protein
MQPLPLTPAADRLVGQLQDAAHQPAPASHAYHVAGMGAAFYFAYEQLRNVAEYREHHLLLRSAIGRYLMRYVRHDKYEPAAAELVTELTQAGYLKNDSVPVATITEIDRLLSGYALMYQTLHATRRLNRATTADWFDDIASVQIEKLLSPDLRTPVLMQLAYDHYAASIDRARALGKHQVPDQHYRIALFCAVQRALFKSDPATTRYYYITSSLPDLIHTPIEHFVELNYLISELYQAPVTNQLVRLINRYGAPIRILRELVLEGGGPDLLVNRTDTLGRVRAVCAQQYANTHNALRARVGKSILFILITKTLLGVAFEIPYDLATTGVISALPLVLNIGFPLLYMLTIAGRIRTPSRQNTEVVASYIDRILYDGAGAPIEYAPKRRVSKRSLNALFNTIYAIGFVVSLGLLLWALRRLGFNLANGIIFFLFLSAVSFLGFRIRQSAHELVMLDERQGVLQTLADFFSAPFVRIGHWLSDKYAKANFVTGLLDLIIEMPLKTTLRLMRQWVSFLRDKQDEL